MDDLTLGLNRNEKLFLGLEDVAGSMNLVLAIRLKGAITERAARSALREVVRAHPRLRARVVPTLLGRRFRVRADGPRIDAKFDEACRVLAGAGVDDESVSRVIERLANESFALDDDRLLLRARFIPHPSTPVLVLCAHHLLGDARTFLAWFRSFQRALRGEPLPLVPLDQPGYDIALAARAPGGRAGALGRSLRALFARARKRGLAFRLPRSAPFDLGSIVVAPLRVRPPLTALLRAARERGVSLTGFLAAAIAETLARASAESEAHFRARISIDLRDRFPEAKPTDGNYVSTFYVVFDRAGFEDMVAEAGRDLRAGIDRFASGERLLVGLLAEIGMSVGRRPLGLAIRALEALDMVTSETFQLSNLGYANGLADGPVAIESVLSGLRCCDLFVLSTGIDDHLMVSLSCPESILPRSELLALRDTLGEVLAERA